MIEIVNIEEEKYPIAMYRPYIYAKILCFSTFFIVEQRRKVKVISDKGSIEKKARNNRYNTRN